MTKEKLRAFLQSTGIITTSQAMAIADEFRSRNLAKGNFLLQAGSVSDEYFFLSEGLVRTFAYDVAGNDVTTGFYSSGQLAVEVASFFQRTPSQEYMQALTDCAGWAITHAQLNALFHTRPEFREFGRSMLVHCFATLKSRMLATITEPATARYARLLHASPLVRQHAPLKHIASYLGITDTSLSRIRKDFSRK